MRVLFSSQGIAGSPDVRPVLPVVWRSVHPSNVSMGIRPYQVQRAAAEGACRLDAVRTCGSRSEVMREVHRVLRAGWPGAGIGVRAPEQDETPLSAAEALYLLPTFEIRA
jgi:hypothetical protein